MGDEWDAWDGSDDKHEAYVPPGESRVVKVPRPAATARWCSVSISPCACVDWCDRASSIATRPARTYFRALLIAWPAMAALAAKSVGWSKDPADTERAARCLGVDTAVYERAAAAWSDRVRGDVVLAAFYGQLFAQA